MPLTHSARNWATFRRQPLAEISGALGDLGTFLPILIALAVNGSISLPATLVFSGLYNILTGVFFGIPLPVQPMKAIAAVAISRSFCAGEIAAAGSFVGAVILLFSTTGALRWFAGVVPIPVVKGIQVGAGLSLVVAAGAKIKGELSWLGPRWVDNYLWTIAAFAGLVVTNIYRRAPYGLILFLLGLVFAFAVLATSDGRFPSWGLELPGVVRPSLDEWTRGIMEAGIGQIPLTTLNSIIAVVHLAGDLLPDVRTPSITSIGLSVSGMNLLGVWFGCMPVCHGSGGLAAQYRFGARSGASVIVLGVVKLIVGVFLGNTLIDLLKAFPTAFLSVMVIAAGLELASVGESLNTAGAWDLGKHDRSGVLPTMRPAELQLSEAERKQRWTVMIVTVGLLLAFKNDGIGFVAGFLGTANTRRLGAPRPKPKPQLPRMTPKHRGVPTLKARDSAGLQYLSSHIVQRSPSNMSSHAGLASDQVAFFKDNGYLVIPDYLPQDTISALRATTTDLLNSFPLSSHPLTRFTTGDDEEENANNAKHVGDEYFLTSGDKVRFFFEPDAFSPTTNELTRPKHLAVNKIGHSLHSLSPPFSNITHNGTIGARNAAIARSLGFRDPRVLQSMVICKQPGIGAAVPPHKDSEFLFTDPPSAVGWWFALQDAGRGNGGLGFWKGSHKRGRVRRRFVRSAGADISAGTEFIDWSGPGLPKELEGEGDDYVPVDEDFEMLDIPAGSLVLIHGNALHKSEKNTSEQSRFAYTFHVIEGAEGWNYDERNWLQPPENGEGFTRLYAGKE
ncbi:conserved hypothetical protein [Uncinocarpus reesii 1704]|uniref:Uncharacterized protein n=1 Tax=Uncinocarpus reesii (strain UAMH 1704) TaxID=336963 RepID=C4JWX0_UNCRE|nr:uncharacterized protein UREG_06143 [Uncinocarpus reesii 1704]EEP81278.1 conserved hypothetical protein [Uncinocarpus reesii 1704]